jgi:hypothetical protein
MFWGVGRVFLFPLRVRFIMLWRQTIEFKNATFLPLRGCHKINDQNSRYHLSLVFHELRSTIDTIKNTRSREARSGIRDPLKRIVNVIGSNLPANNKMDSRRKKEDVGFL